MTVWQPVRWFGIAVILLILAIELILAQSGRVELKRLRASLDDQNAATQELNRQLSGQLGDLKEAVRSLGQLEPSVRTELTNENAILDRVTGTYIPLKVPASTEALLTRLDSMVADQSHWPTTSSESETALSDLSTATKSIPPYAEEDLLPRLNCLRWSIQVISLAGMSGSFKEEAVQDALDRCHSLELSRPEGTPDAIAAKLKSLTNELEARQARSAKDAALTAAAAAANQDDLEVIDKALNGLTSLDQNYADTAAKRKLLVDRLYDVKAQQLTKQFAQLKALSDLRLKKLGITKFYEVALAQQLDFALAVDVPASSSKALGDLVRNAENSLKEFADEQREQQAKSLRDYQGWALKQIKGFHETFDDIQSEADAEDAKHWPGWKPGWQDDQYTELEEAMIDHLLVINTNLLEQPVAVAYSTEYDKGWTKLRDGEKADLTARMADVLKAAPAQ